MNGEQNTATETQASFLDRLREATTDEQVILYRVSGRELEFIDRYGAASIAASTEADIMADVKAEHGGGSYELRLIDARGTIRGRDKFSIAGLPKRPKEERETASSGGNELAALVAAMQQQSAQMQQMFMAGLDKIAAAVTPPPSGGMKEVLDLLATAREIVTPPASVNPASPVSQLKEFLQIKSLLGELDGGKSGGDWGDLLGMAAPLLQMAQQQAAPAPAPTAPTKPRPRALPKPTGTRTLPAGMTEAEEAQYRANVAQLVTLAANGTTAASVAQLIVAQSPDREQLAQLVAADPVPWLAQFDQRVTQYADWFRALGQEIAGLIDEPIPALDGAAASAGPAAAATRRGRHPANATDHGATGAPGPGASRRPRARRAAGAAPAAEALPG